MEAVPRLPMISFELNVSPETTSFGPKIKQYITSFYHEDGETYITEIHNLEQLRAAAVRPTIDVAGCQNLKKYYCQLHFLKSRFPMEDGQAVAVNFVWKNPYSNLLCNISDIQFELMAILYNIGALHSKLGAEDSRATPDGMKMACTHFQCAAWAFQTIKETFPQMVNLILVPEIVHYMQQVCLAQAQECILEKSMTDTRKPIIIAKVAVQVVEHYKHALQSLQAGGEEGSFSDLIGSRIYKEWVKYLSFKVAYHKCIALLFQGQQAEEQQKMGERVAFYQAACDQLEEARKLSSNMSHQQEIGEALAFTSDVVEGKRKAARNENDFIYHEDVPEKDALQEVKGASLVKGIPFSVTDTEVSGNDIFARLVPMEAHEASSLYSEKKAQMLRQLGEIVESKDQKLAEFMSSLQLEFLTQMRQASGLTQDLVDSAAAISARPAAVQDLIDAMTKLSGSYHEVEAMLNEIQELLKEEEQNEKEYQEIMGKRPPSIIATDLAREAAKYREAHTKASESNQTLHKAMTTRIANLKILAQPLAKLQLQIPSVELPNKNVDDAALKELESLLAKIEEMKTQRAMLWAQLREAVHNDDITSVIVTRPPDQPIDQIFQQQLQKHQQLCSLIEQNGTAQENILKALVDAYADFTNSRRYLQDVINKRNTTISALITSYETYDDLLSRANKGIDFYNKLETNVSKLLQRIKSASKVQEEEREQMLSKANLGKPATNIGNIENVPANTGAPKLKDYLDSMKKDAAGLNTVSAYSAQSYPAVVNLPPDQSWPPGVRPAPVGQEMAKDSALPATSEQLKYINYDSNAQYNQLSTANTDSANTYLQNTTYNTYNQRLPANYPYNQQQNYPTEVSQQTYTDQTAAADKNADQVLADRMAALMASSKKGAEYLPNQYAQYGYNPQTNHTYSATNYSYPAITQSYTLTSSYQQVPGAQTANYASYSASGNTDTNTYYSLATGQPLNYPQNYSLDTSQQQQNYTQNDPQQNYSYSANQPQNYSGTSAQQVSSQSQNYTLPTGQLTTNLPQCYSPSLNQPQNYSLAANQQPVSQLAASQPQNYSSTANQQPTSQLTVNQQSADQFSQNYSSTVNQQPTNQFITNQQPTIQPQSYSPSPNQLAVNQPVIPQFSVSSAADTVSAYAGAYSSYIPQGYGPSGVPISGVNHMSYSANAYNLQNQGSNFGNETQSGNGSYSYGNVESGYEPNRDTATPQQYNYDAYNTYYAQNPSSTAPQSTQNASLYSADNYVYTQANTYPYYNNYYADTSQTAVSTNYTPQQLPQVAPIQNNSTYVTPETSQNVPTQNVSVIPQIAETQSNVDLLAGLDFSVSQEPLLPQPSTTSLDAKVEKEEAKAKSESHISVVSKQSVPNVAERPIVKKSEVKLLEIPKRNLLENPDTFKLFVQEVEKYKKFVELLTTKTLSGPTTLDLKWKEIQDKQDLDAQKRSISVARCYPIKNRSADILPYDYSRVELSSTKDDYINASHIKDITPYTPPFIVTQTPMSSTFADFWTMIREQNVEIIVCLLCDNELGDEAYWPKERGQDLNISNLVISLQNVIVKQYWTERTITVSLPEQRESKTVMHLQFTAWPGSLFPTTAAPFVSFVKEVISLQQQQRVAVHPVLVHCFSGVGRSGIFCLLIPAILDLAVNPTSIPDLTALAVKISAARKNVLRDREHLKFAFQAFLQHLKDLEEKQNVKKEPSVQATEDVSAKIETQADTEDPLSSLDPFWASKK